jgi:CheY-like chemotaxis protein
LLAEDESLAALALGDALSEMGHAVVHAADGETALGLAAALPFDVLVTDIAMPRLSGLELIPLLRAERPGLPVVMMTGWLPPDGAKLLAEPGKGPMTLLLKPFELSQLAEALARVAPR